MVQQTGIPGSTSTSRYNPVEPLIAEPNVPGLSEVKLPLNVHDKTRRLNTDEQVSCSRAPMLSKANVSSSKHGLALSGLLTPNQAAAASTTPDVHPPGVFEDFQTLQPPVFCKQVPISSAVCLPRPTMPSMIQPHMQKTSNIGSSALSLSGHKIVSAACGEENPPGVGEMPSVTAISSAKTSSTHLQPFPQAYTGNSLPAFPLVPPEGMASRFSARSYGFYSQFPPPPPPPLPPRPPPPPPPQRHTTVSGPPHQIPRFALCKGTIDIGRPKEAFIIDKEKLTLFVGKIVPSLSDNFLTSILELCGSIRSWTRAQDPVTGSHKGFGFCEYESPDSLLRALRLLNRLKLEGQELVLKVDQATLNYLEHYIDEKIERLKAQMLTEAESAPGLEASNAVEQLTFDVPREVPVEERLGWVYDKENEVDKEVCKKLVKLLEERDQVEWVDSPSSVVNTQLEVMETDEEYEQGGPTEESWKSVKLTEWKQFEYALERCKLKVQGVHGTCRSSEAYYLEFEKLWEERERAKEIHRNMERERAEAARKTRYKLLKKQEESSRSHKRVCYGEKYKKQLLEKEKDDKDRILEQQESGYMAASGSRNKDDNHLFTGELSQNRFLDLSTRAKIAFCFKSSSKQRPSEQVHMHKAVGDSFWGGEQHSMDTQKQQRPVESSVHYRNPTFTWERESTPEEHLSFSERERMPSASKSSGMHYEKPVVILKKERARDMKELIDSLPSTKNEIFSFCMDWSKFDEHCLHERIRPWVSKKISEFLGEEEATLVDFIVTSAKKHTSPAHLLELLENIFVEEAELFVVKLWRVVIYELRKVECGFSAG